MGFRCELCDDFLSVFQLSRLCENCYKVRTIIKCYDSAKILDCLETNFIVDYENKTTLKKITKTKSTGSLSTIKEESKIETEEWDDKNKRIITIETDKEVVAKLEKEITDESYYPPNCKRPLRSKNKKVAFKEN